MAKSNNYENGDRDKNHHRIWCNGNWHSYDPALLKVGSAFCRLLAACYTTLKTPTREAEARFGLSSNQLARYRTDPGQAAHFATVLRVCMRTQMFAAELSFQPNDWAKDVDEKLRAMKWKPSPKNSIKNAVGDQWESLRNEAEEDLAQSPLTEEGSAPLDSKIQRLIATNSIGRGVLICEWRLATSFDARPSEIRSALESLHFRGLLDKRESKKEVSFFVRKVSVREGREILQMRKLCESWLMQELLIGKLARLDKTTAQMEQYTKLMESNMHSKNSKMFMENDIRFHLALCDGRPFFRNALEVLLSMIRTSSVKVINNNRQRMRTVIREHRNITEAMKGAVTARRKKRTPPAFDSDPVQLLTDHLSRGRRAVL